MPHSPVHLVNSALIRIGELPITSLTENSREAILANQLYEKVRDDVMASYPWNSAMKREALPKLATAPAFGFSNQHQLPPDFLRLYRLEDNSLLFRIEGRTILSDEDPLNIIYVSRITDPQEMDQLLKDAISTRLSFELSIPLTGSATVQANMARLHQSVISEARFSDAMQSPVDQVGGSSWLDGRQTSEPATRITDFISP